MIGEITNSSLVKVGNKPVEIADSDILCVVGIRNEIRKIQYFLKYYRDLGVNKFIFMDNCSDDGTFEYLQDQQDCFLFRTHGSHFEMNTLPPRWTNAILNVYGKGKWCVVVDSDELLVYPNCENLPLPAFCRFLDEQESTGLMVYMIDQYSEGPVIESSYESEQPFMEASPYFDSEPGWIRAYNGSCPAVQMFGGVRERVFWHGKYRRLMPPCLTKVSLVKWGENMRYYAAQHTMSKTALSDVVGGLLHYKFLTGFDLKTNSELEENVDLEEKGLQEREAYSDAIRANPGLSLKNANSVKYKNSHQLVELGWMKTTPLFENYCSSLLSA